MLLLMAMHARNNHYSIGALQRDPGDAKDWKRFIAREQTTNLKYSYITK